MVISSSASHVFPRAAVFLNGIMSPAHQQARRSVPSYSSCRPNGSTQLTSFRVISGPKLYEIELGAPEGRDLLRSYYKPEQISGFRFFRSPRKQKSDKLNVGFIIAHGSWVNLVSDFARAGKFSCVKKAGSGIVYVFLAANAENSLYK